MLPIITPCAIYAREMRVTRRIQGHINDFGVNGNGRRLSWLVDGAKKAWYKWLRRRSQPAHLTWGKFGEWLKRLPLARPQVKVQLGGKSPRDLAAEEPEGGNLLVRFGRGPRGRNPLGLLYMPAVEGTPLARLLAR